MKTDQDERLAILKIKKNLVRMIYDAHTFDDLNDCKKYIERWCIHMHSN